MHSLSIAATILASTLFGSVSAKPTPRSIPDFGGKSKLVVYWGAGSDQKPLADYCDDDTIDIIPLAFVNKFPGQDGTYDLPGTTFGNACYGDEYYIDENNHKTAIFNPCANIERDMAICQQKGKKILISIGGDSPGNQLTSSDAASSFAQQLWEIFGPKTDGYTGPRPFGDNVVDGFDFDIESGDGSYVPDLVAHLSGLTAEDNSKKYYLTAAPQCPMPDTRLSAALSAAPFDHVFIQFYNNPGCSARSSFNGGGFNWDAWAQWLSSNSMNKDISLFLGLPASSGAAPSYPNDYLNLDEAQSLIEELACSSDYKSQFGGVMLWEATFSENNQQNGKSYAESIKSVIEGCSCFAQPITSTTSSTTTTTSTTTSTYSTTTSTYSTTTSTYSTTTPAYSTTTSPTSTPSSTTTTTSSYGPGPGSSTPEGSKTTSSSSSSSYSWSDWPVTTSTSSSKPADPTSTSSSTWADWTVTTTTTSKPVDPTSTSSTYSWEDWQSTTSSSKPVDPTTTSSTYSWEDWESTTSSSKPADPTTTSSTQTWADWPITSSSAPVDPTSSSSTSAYTWADWSSSTVDPTTNIYTTVWGDWSSSSPDAATATSTTTWADWSGTPITTLAVSTITQGAGSNLVYPPEGTSKPVAPTVSSLVSSSYPVAPAVYTGTAPADELPGTVLSIAICVAVAIGGLFL